LTEVVGAAAEGELRRLERRLARVAPEATPELLRQVMQESPRAQELRARRTNPAARDAQGRLGAWLGDLSAAEGLARWEARVCNRFLNGELTEQDAGEFVEGWLALRELLWVPSYTRALGLLVPVYDAVEQRIGYWRIVLPRLTWMVKRKTDLSSHPDWGDLPFDLLPERPRAFEHLRGLLVRDPELGPLLRSSGWNVRDVRYATLQPFAKRDHLRAFQHFRVTIEWASADERVAFEVEIEAAKRGHHHDPVERISVRATSSGGRRATELAERLQRLGIIDM
jgi:hypothetical protein